MVNPLRRFMNWLMMNDDFEITVEDPVRILDNPKAPPELKEAIIEAQRSTPLSKDELDQLTDETAAIIKAAEGKPS